MSFNNQYLPFSVIEQGDCFFQVSEQVVGYWKLMFMDGVGIFSADMIFLR